MLNAQQPEVREQGEASNEIRLPHGVMEGNGAYNKYAQSQAAGAVLAIPVLQAAVQKIALEPGEQPIIIADYGSSQGKNSLAPIGSAIRHLRARADANRPICVFHIDQPANDFTSLFEVLNSDPHRYLLDQANVFPCAIGRSFYEQVLPPESVYLGWCSNAAMWLRRVPALIPGHFWSGRSTGAVRAAFERQAAEDWEVFLSIRALEMRNGARLVIVLPTVLDSSSSGIAELMDHANAVLQEMVEEAAITATERAAMVLGSHPRRKSDILAPFAKEGHYQGLVVEDYGEFELPDHAWIEYQNSGDTTALASKRALFFRSTFMPSLASALTRARNGDREALTSFADRLESGLRGRLVRCPAPSGITTQAVTLAKPG
jgi:hypothetical protein